MLNSETGISGALIIYHLPKHLPFIYIHRYCYLLFLLFSFSNNVTQTANFGFIHYNDLFGRAETFFGAF